MKSKKEVNQTRNRYNPGFKRQELERTEKDGVAAAALDLYLQESQLCNWRQKQQLEGLTSEEQKLQHAELAQLKRGVAAYP